VSVGNLATRALARGRGLKSRMASRHIVSLGRADPDIIFVAGTGRSGTTWLAELLIRSSRRRLVFEPFRNDRVPEWSHAASRQYIRPDDSSSRFLDSARRILDPTFRNEWADYYNERFLTRGRVVKDIRANLMLRWLFEQFGPFPIIFLIRHPGAVAASWRREEWTLPPVNTFFEQHQLVEDHLVAVDRALWNVDDPFGHALLTWSIETSVVLSEFEPESVLVVFYEDLVLHPLEEWRRISDFIDDPTLRPLRGQVATPSATTTPGVTYESQRQRLTSWSKRLSEDDARRVRLIPGLLGVDDLYGEDALPNSLCRA
jgi:hypothetical protein